MQQKDQLFLSRQELPQEEEPVSKTQRKKIKLDDDEDAFDIMLAKTSATEIVEALFKFAVEYHHVVKWYYATQRICCLHIHHSLTDHSGIVAPMQQRHVIFTPGWKRLLVFPCSWALHPPSILLTPRVTFF